MAEEDIDIFNNSQEYFDSLRESSKPDPDRIAREKAIYKSIGAIPGKIKDSLSSIETENVKELIPTKDELKNFAAKAGAAAVDFPIVMANIPIASFTAAESFFRKGDTSDMQSIPYLTPLVDEFTKTEANLLSDVGATFVGGGATFVAQMKVLNKIEKSAPTLYKKLSNTFPYLVEHAHQYYKKIGNPTSKTLGGKALDFITTSLQEIGAFGRKTGEIIPDIWKRSASNIAKIAKYGGYTSLLMADNYEPEGMESDLFDSMVDYEGIIDNQFYREDDSGNLKTIDLPEPSTTQEEMIKTMKERQLRDKNYGFPEWMEQYLGIKLQDDPSDRQPGIENEPNKKPEIPFSDIKFNNSQEYFDYLKSGKIPKQLAYGGEPEQEDIFEMLQENDPDGELPPLQESNIPNDIFQAAKDEGYNEVEVANLFGKVPMWAVANVSKAKMLLQMFTKNEKKNMDNVKNKLGTEEQVLRDLEDIDILDTQTAGTVVGAPKIKKTIIDSPEDGESAFYSGLEARLMDPDTPNSFSNKKELNNFLNSRGISKAETEDNLLTRYIEIAEKNNVPISKASMLEILRKAPMRKINTITYGDAKYGGTKRPVYANQYYEPESIPGSYREEVLYLPPENIPLDPGTLPGAGHDFDEKYVIGWTRKTDRMGKLPVDETAEGIAEQIDPKMMKTLKRNQTKLNNQIKGLETSAIGKLDRAFPDMFDDVDELSEQMIRDILNETDTLAKLRSIDEPLEQQLLQFKMKLNSDGAKLQKMEAATTGESIKLTMADEIQSDILQQAKEFENKIRSELGSLMDLSPADRIKKIQTSGNQYDFSSEVAEFFVRNQTVFRPVFKNAAEMEIFINKFNDNKKIFEQLADAGPRPSPTLIKKATEAEKLEQTMLLEIETAISENAMKQLHPNLPFKDRSEWGEALIKMDLSSAANLLYGANKVPDAATWYAVSPSKFITKRYRQTGGTNTPINERTKDMKGIGMEEFYGGPDSLSTSIDKSGTAATNKNFGKPKHYTSTLEKALKRAATENNSEFKIIEVDGMGKVFAIKITPEMLLPHKTHRKDGGMVYTPELIDIFEAA